MIKIALCDDDLSVLKELGILLEHYQARQEQKIDYLSFCSPLELLAEVAKGLRLDILLLDVLMPGENGINAAREIRQYDNNVKIIFLTSSPEFAVQSYTVGAFFYQIKPICEEGFFALMDAVIAKCRAQRDHSLLLRCKTGIVRIDLEQLAYCEVIRRTLFWHMENGTVWESIGSLEGLWSEVEQYGNFLHPHRSFVINMEYVTHISTKAITMYGMAQIPIPHGRYTEIKNTYLEYAFQRKQVLPL